MDQRTPLCKVIFQALSLYFTKNGVNKEPKSNIAIPTTIVTNIFLKDEKKLPNINIGIIVRETNVNLPGMVILCSMSHLSHTIGLYAQLDL